MPPTNSNVSSSGRPPLTHMRNKYPKKIYYVSDDDESDSGNHSPARQAQAYSSSSAEYEASLEYVTSQPTTPIEEGYERTDTRTSDIFNMERAFSGRSFESASSLDYVSTRPSTPGNGGYSVTGTPSTRGSAIERAFSEISFTSPSQSSSQDSQPRRMKCIVVGDSDDSDDDKASNDVFQSTKGTSQRGLGKGGNIGESSLTWLKSSIPSVNQTQPRTPSRNIQSISSQKSSTSSSTVKPSYPKRAETLPAIGTNEPNRLSAQNGEPVRSHTLDPPTRLNGDKYVPPLNTQPSTTQNAVDAFADSSFGTGLSDFIIAHSKEVQFFLDHERIAWGTQYELARGVSTGLWTWNDVRLKIRQLTGSNALAASQVQAVMRSSRAPVEASEMAIWEECDREDEALLEGKGRGLGLMGTWKGVPDWYGGRIQQKVKLELDPQTRNFKVVIRPLEKRRSHRFARFYGSRRFLQMKISKDLLRDQNKRVLEFLRRRFILCGRTFVPFHPKDGSIYLVETDEDFQRQPVRESTDSLRLSFKSFINWHNPLKRNFTQAMAKYVTRFALGLSNSIPALEFKEQDVYFIEDKVVAGSDPKTAPADKLLTDGCGFLNRCALSTIAKNLAYENLPAAVQGRIGGSKGLWILHPHDRADRPKIWIRDSQHKIKGAVNDRAHLIFDLLAPSKPAGPSSISQQSVINLYSNGVEAPSLIELMQEGLTREISPLLEWNNMVFLWHAIDKAGGVVGSRSQRFASALSRALGLKGRDWGDESDDGDDDGEVDDDEGLSFTGRNRYSGQPLGLHEMALEMVQSGFHPSSNSMLFEKVKWMMNLLIKKCIEKCYIPLEDSLYAYVVPDPLGVLKEGEIFYRFSRPRKNPQTEMLYHVLNGDVVVGRFPIYLPCDMQKVKAVDRSELYDYLDVIVIPTCGERSLANLLSGGDMDGDEFVVIWDPRIVEPFVSKPFTPPPDDLIQANFQQHGAIKVHAFCEQHLQNIQGGRIGKTSEALLEIMLGDLVDDCKGLYSMFHTVSTTKHGYDHKMTIRLAYIFTTLLDASKTGHRLNPKVFQKDKANCWGDRKSQSENQSSLSESGSQSQPKPGILPILMSTAQEKGQELLNDLQRGRTTEDVDADLLKPYQDACDFASAAEGRGVPQFAQELRAIREHVQRARKEWGSAISKHMGKKEQNQGFKGKNKSFGKQEDLTLRASKMYAEPVDDVFFTKNVDELKASYAYSLKERFAFAVAFHDLCHIKAAADPGGTAPTCRIFDEARSVTNSFLRALKSCEGK